MLVLYVIVCGGDVHNDLMLSIFDIYLRIVITRMPLRSLQGYI